MKVFSNTDSGLSIPHRQALNWHESVDIINTLFLSIPHRQALNMRPLNSHPTSSFLSIPHRQALNGKMKEFIHVLPDPPFNPSQVGFKLATSASYTGTNTAFNPSQVGFKFYGVRRMGKNKITFNPSQVGFKQRRSYGYVMKYSRLSIPHRQALNKTA